MKAKHCVAVLAIAALLIPALWAVVQAADKRGGSVPKSAFEDERGTLRGLQGVAVVVQAVKPEVERLGLTKEALQIDTELQLRQYSIKVLSSEEHLATPGMPYLSVYVNVLGADDDRVPVLAVNILLQCFQSVSLERAPTMRCRTATWAETQLTMVKRDNLRQVRDWVKDGVAAFINDYLAVNHRQPAPTQEGRGSEAKQ